MAEDKKRIPKYHESFEKEKLKEYLRERLKPVLTKIKLKAADAARILRG